MASGASRWRRLPNQDGHRSAHAEIAAPGSTQRYRLAARFEVERLLNRATVGKCRRGIAAVHHEVEMRGEAVPAHGAVRIVTAPSLHASRPGIVDVVRPGAVGIVVEHPQDLYTHRADDLGAETAE